MGVTKQGGVNHTNDMPEDALPVNITGIKYSGNSIQVTHMNPVDKTEAKVDGDQPSFGMPPFANGVDKRNRG